MNHEARHLPLLAVHIQYVQHAHPEMQPETSADNLRLADYDVNRLRRIGENLYNRFGAFDVIFHPPRTGKNVTEEIVRPYTPQEKDACHIIQKEELSDHKSRENFLHASSRMKKLVEDISLEWTDKCICIISDPNVTFGLREAWRFFPDPYSHAKPATRIQEEDSVTIFEFRRTLETSTKKQLCD